MTQEFVSHEQALELKELGFDEPCLTYWEGESFSHHLATIEGDDYIIPAPLYQQAFRWFREKYKMAIISPDWNNKFKYKVFNLHLLTQGVLVEETGFSTYEEAEIACLNKLIEIVESKSKEK